MTAPVNSTPLSVDYTSRDYYSLRNELIQRIKERTGNTWQGNDPADFGVALVEAFSYMGDITNYYIDRIANESYIGTATQRQSILNIAKTYGYYPTGYRSANLDLTFTNNIPATVSVQPQTPTFPVSGSVTLTTSSVHGFLVGQQVIISGITPTGYNATATVTAVTPTTFTYVNATTGAITVGGSVANYAAITIPQGTVFTTEATYGDTVYQMPFTTQTAITLNAGSSGAYTLAQFEDVSTRTANIHYLPNSTTLDGIPGEDLLHSDGTPNQQRTLSENQVADGSVRVFVENNGVWEEWNSIIHLTDAGPADAVFSITTDSNNFVCITFGDGVSGYIPPNGYRIRAVYKVTIGSLGNISSGTSFAWGTVPNLTDLQVAYIKSNVSVSSNSLTGAINGSDPEDDNTIRTNAPKALTAFNRAVTLKDFGNLSLLVPSVGKANADAAVWNSVNVYVAPLQTTANSNPDTYPGYIGTNKNIEGSRTSSMVDLVSSVSSYLSDKIQIGTTVSVFAPVYVDAWLSVQYTMLPGFTTDQVEKNIKTAIFDSYSYANADFAQVITPESVEANLRYTAGVSSIKVLYLSRVTAVTSVATGGGTATFTTSTAHGLQVGQTIAIAGLTPIGYNGAAVVTAVPTPTSFSISTAVTGAITVAGTVSANVRAPIVGAPGELFTFLPANTTVSYLSSVASISTLVVSTAIGSGVLTSTPTFSSTFYNYNVTTTTTTTYLTITSVSGGTISVNGSPAISGTAFALATPTGVTTATIVVTSADGIYGTTYKVNITK